MIDEKISSELQEYILLNNIEAIKEFFVNHPRYINEALNEQGTTILMFAIENCAEDIINTLLTLDVTPDLTLLNTHGETAQDISFKYGYTRIYELIEQSKSRVAVNKPSKGKLVSKEVLFEFFAELANDLIEPPIDEPNKHQLYLHLNALVNNAIDMRKASNEELFDIFLTAESLVDILEKSEENSVKQDLQIFFNQRDLSIRGTRLDYCYHQGLVNQNLSSLVTNLWQKQLENDDERPNSVYDILMFNSLLLLDQYTNTNADYFDVVELEQLSVPKNPRDFVRDLDGYIHIIYNNDDTANEYGIIARALEKLVPKPHPSTGELTAAAQKRQELWLCQDNRVKAEVTLDRGIVDWLSEQYQGAQELDSYVYQFEKAAKNNDVRQQINLLIAGLEAGGKKKGSGSEEYAGDESMLATSNFGEWLNKYKVDYPQNYANMMNIVVGLSNGKSGADQDYTDTTLEQILYPLIHTMEASKNNSASSCSDQNGSNLKTFIENREVSRQIDELNSDAATPITIKKPSELEAIKAQIIDDINCKKSSKNLLQKSKLLTNPFPVSDELFYLLCDRSDDGYNFTYKIYEKLQSLFKIKGTAKIKQLLFNSRNLQGELDADYKALTVSMDVLFDERLTDRQLLSLPYESLKAYIATINLHDLNHKTSSRVLTHSLQQAVDQPTSQQHWLDYLIDHGLSPYARISCNDLRFLQLQVGTQIVKGATLIDYQIVERDESRIRIRPPEDLTPVNSGRVDHYGNVIYNYPVTYDTDGKDDLWFDLKYHWQDLYIGKTGQYSRRQKLMQPKLNHVSLINYAIITSNVELFKKLLDKGLAPEFSYLFNSNQQVVSKYMMIEIISNLAEKIPQTKLSLNVLLQLFSECKRLQRTDLITRLVKLGLDPNDYRVTMRLKNSYRQVNLIEYALATNNQNLIRACIDKKCFAKREQWFGFGVSKIASFYYLEYILERGILNKLDGWQVLFDDNFNALKNYANEPSQVDENQLAYSLKLFSLIFNKSRLVKRRTLNEVFTTLRQLHLNLDDNLKERFSLKIKKMQLEIIIKNMAYDQSYNLSNCSPTLCDEFITKLASENMSSSFDIANINISTMI